MKKMSTKAYIIKYKLNENDKFSHSDFVTDFVSEFGMRIINNNAVRDYFRYEKTINEAKAKYDAINNKTLGDIGTSLWDFIFGRFISEFREFLFPTYGKERVVENGTFSDAEFLAHVEFTLSIFRNADK